MTISFFIDGLLEQEIYSISLSKKTGAAIKVVVLDIFESALTMKQAVLRDIFGVVMLPLGLAIDIYRIAQGIDISVAENLTTINLVIVYSSLGWFAIEMATMLTNKKRRALHDYIAGSVVVRRLHDET